MYPEFIPLIPNPHLATIAGNFWRRNLSPSYSVQHRTYRIDADTTIISLEHEPPASPIGQIVCLHGLEGSAEAGYVRSLTASALAQGFGVHRLNLRTCGGSEHLCRTMYHSGLTIDTWTILQRLRNRFSQPLFLVGFSLGGNVALKLAGEFEVDGVLSGVCSVSAPIDLAACVRAIDKPGNLLYARRFLSRLKGRILRKSSLDPDTYSSAGLDDVKSIWEFDDRFTAPLFGFGSAANYYETQSASRFLDKIRIPALMIAAQDDPLVPFSVYRDANFAANPHIHLLAPQRGGHLGFVSRRKPRFWIDEVVMQWVNQIVGTTALQGTQAGYVSST